jgi:putative beta-lysine N-acetyltransferase
MIDRVENLGGSVVQHGPHNDRAYLMKASDADLPGLVAALDGLARRQGYSKIFAKVRSRALETFRDAGYRVEATVPGFYGGAEDGHFLGKYLDAKRAEEPDPDRVEAVLAECGAPRRALPPLGPGLRMVVLDGRHVERLAALYGEVFDSYPFPIDDPEFLRSAMAQDTVYHGVFSDGTLVAASSAEMDRAGENAEMTDFATLPTARRQGLAGHLLTRMHADMRETGIRTLYTIARAVSFGMNLTFARLGYRFAGTLTANTQIMGRFESMNVWYRPAEASAG